MQRRARRSIGSRRAVPASAAVLLSSPRRCPAGQLQRLHPRLKSDSAWWRFSARGLHRAGRYERERSVARHPAEAPTSMNHVRAIVADACPAMRRWYAAALRRVADDPHECATGWELLLRLAEDRSCDLVVASRSLPGLTGARVLAMLRSSGSDVPFVLVAPLRDGRLRSLVRKVRRAALVEDSLDGVRLADAAATLVRSAPARAGQVRTVRRAVGRCAQVVRRNRPSRERA